MIMPVIPATRLKSDIRHWDIQLPINRNRSDIRLTNEVLRGRFRQLSTQGVRLSEIIRILRHGENREQT